MFFWNSFAFSMIQWMLVTWSLVPLPFLNPVWTSGSSQFTYCWSLAWRILSITLLACDSTLAWKIPWTEEPGRLQSMGSLGVGHDWATSLSLFTLMHWRRKWQPTPVFLPGESQGPRAWWAAVYGVAQSRIRLKRLSSSVVPKRVVCTYVTGAQKMFGK